MVPALLYGLVYGVAMSVLRAVTSGGPFDVSVMVLTLLAWGVPAAVVLWLAKSVLKLDQSDVVLWGAIATVVCVLVGMLPFLPVNTTVDALWLPVLLIATVVALGLSFLSSRRTPTLTGAKAH